LVVGGLDGDFAEGRKQVVLAVERHIKLVPQVILEHQISAIESYHVELDGQALASYQLNCIDRSLHGLSIVQAELVVGGAKLRELVRSRANWDGVFEIFDIFDKFWRVSDGDFPVPGVIFSTHLDREAYFVDGPEASLRRLARRNLPGKIVL